MTSSRSTRWTLVVNAQRAWVFERTGARGQMKPVFSFPNPAARAGAVSQQPAAGHHAPAERAILGWAMSLGEHMRLAHSAGRYDTLELIAPSELAEPVEAAARYHVDLMIDEHIDAADEDEVRDEARKITRRFAAR